MRRGSRCARERLLGLGSSEYEALHFIRKNPGACQDAVVQGLGMEKSAVAHLMAGLEQKGFITRTKDPQDNSRRLLFATPKAERLRDSRAALEAYYYQWAAGKRLRRRSATRFCRRWNCFIKNLKWLAKRLCRNSGKHEGGEAYA